MNDQEEKPLLFKEYEVQIILDALDALRQKEYVNCKWEQQEYGYYYTPNRRVKQINFVERSIKRQRDPSMICVPAPPRQRRRGNEN